MKKIIYSCGIGLLLLASCSKKTLDNIDTNPNVITDAPLNTILPSAEMLVVQRVVGSLTVIGGFVTEHTNFTGVNTSTQFQVGSAGTFSIGGGGNWTSAFQAIRYFKDIRTKADAQGRIGYSAIADIMSAYTLSLMVDAYGDIPYKEAGLENVTQPHFDPAVDLYKEMQTLLDAGIQKCATATATNSPGTDDLILKGNMTLWRKTAWALKARLQNRLSNTDPQNTARAAITSIGSAFAAGESFSFTDFQNTAQNGNQIANNFIAGGTIAIADGIVTALKAFLEAGEDVLADPRANIWFTRIGGKVVTTPTSRATTDVTVNGTSYSKPLYYQNRTSPLPLVTYTEMKFIEAEAQLRLGDQNAAYTAYTAAVRSALSQASIFNTAVALSQSTIDAYMARPKVSPGAVGLTLTTVIQQKYIYLTLFQTVEAYNDVRRTAVITLNDPDGTAKRFPYPADEISRNAFAPQASDQNTVYTTAARLFWAKL